MQESQPSPSIDHRGLSDVAARALFALECPIVTDPGSPGGLTLQAMEHALPGYRIDRLLGRGGMGAVYHGIQHSLEREVAIKLLPPALEDSDPGFGLRFEIEAKSLAKLHHPGIVAVIDAGETDEGLRFIVMEYVAGSTLQQRLLECGRLPWAEALGIVTKVADAIGFAHRHGIIHRDIKPSNILLGPDDQVKVADFGLARRHDAAISPTLTHMVMGSPEYMPPEAMAAGGQSDERSDIFALAAMFYQTLTGHLPRGRFEPVSSVLPGVDGRVDALLDKALQSDPARRHQDIKSLQADLAALRDGRGKRRAVVLAGVLTVVGMITLLVYPRGGAHSDPAEITVAKESAQSSSGRDLPAPLPGFPRGQWVSAVPWPSQVDSPSPSDALPGDGWLLPSARRGRAVCFPYPMTPPGTNWGLRNSCRWNDENPCVRLTVRKQMHQEGDQSVTTEINFEVSSNNAVFGAATSIGSISTGHRLLGDPLPLALKPGELVSIETYVIGDTLIGKVNGVPLVCRIPSDLNKTGGCAITCWRLPFRGSGIVNLDGLSDEEARRIAGSL